MNSYLLFGVLPKVALASRISSLYKNPGNSCIKEFYEVEPFRVAYLVNPDYSGTEDNICFLPGYFLSKAGIG